MAKADALSANLLQSRFGSGEGGIVLLALVLLAVLNTTVMCMMTNARCKHHS